MATTTVTEILTHSVTRTVSGSATPTSSNRAVPQGGIFEHGNPTHWDSKNPIILFIIQAGIVITFCRLLHWPLSKIRQPRVIAEVIGGIILGPSIMGRIPHFSDTIFPANSMPSFSLVANLGLVLFLFLVGLEVDLRYLASNWRIAASVGFAGMAVPFGLGSAISYGLYHSFREDTNVKPISFGTYMLFIAIAMAITAFPVLCRILTELKLLGTPVGIIVLSAGVGNDVVGWVLLALCVALVNASSGVTAVWILLTGLGYTLFLIFLVKPAFMYVLRRTRSLEEGPTQPVIALTLLIALTSAFFTGIIGIHPIFGAFLAGLICPHEGGFAIKVTEKIEDLVSTIFLPLYFALSGLSTNLGLLNSGLTWAYVIGVTCVAFFGKVIGATCAARINGLVWRESFTIGALMSCKGLVELIVLNIGLSANILSQRTFTIFVVMALVTTFATTPLTAALYPPWYQKKLEAWKRGEIDWETGKPTGGSDHDSVKDFITIEKAEAHQISKLLVYLRLDSMPGLLSLAALLGGANERASDDHHSSTNASVTPSGSRAASVSYTRPVLPSRLMSLHGVRLLQLTDRESSVMSVTDASSLSTLDPVVNTFRAFGRLHSIFVSGEAAIVPETYYADTLISRAYDTNSSLILLPWSETGSMSEYQTLSSDGIRGKLTPSMMSGQYADFIQQVLTGASESHVALFINNGFGGGTTATFRPRLLSRTATGISVLENQDPHDEFSGVTLTRQRNHRIFVPYFGTQDDRVAVRFVLQIARDPRVKVVLIHYKLPTQIEDIDLSLSPTATRNGSSRLTTTTNNHPNTCKSSSKPPPTATTTETIPLADRPAAFLAAIRASLPSDLADRITFETSSSSTHDEPEDIRSSIDISREVVERAKMEVRRRAQDAGGDLVVLGRNAGGGGYSGEAGDAGGAGGEGCLGRIGAALLRAEVEASLLVVQAARGSVSSGGSGPRER